MFKKYFDFMGSLFLLMLFLPVMLICAVAILIDSPGGVFYIQKRVGKGEVLFDLIKFRSMVVNADKIGEYYTKRSDTRITRVGKWLRKTSLDELPQLWNVFKGEMSLVGPRPDLPIQKKHYKPSEWQERCSVLPGLTGLAQATLRSSATHQERIDLDLYYVRHLSFWLDLKIFYLTLKQVLHSGSY